MKKHTLSVVLATYNEEANLGRCLESVKDIADEIVIVDGQSVDRTIEIAKKFNAKIIETTNKPNFHINKNMAIDAAKGEWILQLDADEVVSPELAKEIKEHLRGGRMDSSEVNGYWINRKNWFLTQFLTKGGQYPDPTLRLYRKGKGRLPANDVHEQAIVQGQVGHLKHDLLHYRDISFEKYMEGFNRYSSLISFQLADKKININLVNTFAYLFLKPLSTFLKIYFRHRGYVDSMPGFIFALFSGLIHSVAYIKYWQHTKYPSNTLPLGTLEKLMAKIGFITTPLTSAHSVRGVGFYTQRLLEHMKPIAKNFGFEILEIKSLGQLEQLDQLEIIHYPYFDLFQHTLPIIKNIKTIVTIHDVIPLEFPDHYPPGIHGWINLQLQKLALSGVEGVITDSHASVQAIRKYLLVPHEKLKLVYLAADEKFKKISKPVNKYHLPKKFVLYVGDINYNKNIPNLITACAQISMPLVIVGKQASVLNQVDLSHPELRHLQNLDWSNVTRLGFVSDEDLVNIYNLAPVYCQPSFAEGFGLPVLEAMACGTPVACSRAGSLPEIAGDAAVYFDPYNVDDIAKALTTAIKRKRIVVNNFSWEKTARQTLEVYQEIL